MSHSELSPVGFCSSSFYSSSLERMRFSMLPAFIPELKYLLTYLSNKLCGTAKLEDIFCEEKNVIVP